jgi:competence protein ComEA
MMNRLQIARTAFLIVVGLVFLFIVFTVLKRPEPTSPPIIVTLRPLPTTEPATPTPSTINVYVSGAVNKPDVYVLPLNSLVKDAIAAAGGATPEADLDHINLAARLSDQMQVYVPRKGEAVPPPSGGATPGAPGALININTATAEQLDSLPGIGPSIAQAIVDYRTKNGPFKTIEAIKDVPRIGDSLFAKIKDMITVGP